MNRYFKQRIFLCLGFITSSNGVGFGQTVHNPLYDLKYSELCERQKAEGRQYKIPEDKVTVREDGSWEVKSEQIIQKLLNAFPLTLPYKDLKASKSFDEVIIDAVAPCFGTSNPTDENAKENCFDFQKLSQAPHLRFKKHPNALKFRHSLLNLFESAETGARNNFVVVRNEWEKTLPNIGSQDASTNPDEISRKKHTILTYRPMVDARLDDEIIGDYIHGAQLPFSVYCNSKEEMPDTEKETADTSEKSDVETSRKGPNPPKDEYIIFGQNVETAAEDAIPLRTLWTLPERLSKTWPVNERYSGDLEALKKSSSSRQFFLVNSPENIARKKAAYIGWEQSPGEEDGNFKIDAAIGLKLAVKKQSAKAENKFGISENSFSPFVSIEQSPVDRLVLKPTEDDPDATDKKKADYAVYSMGVRVDFLGSDPVKHDYDHLNKNYSYAGTRKPGWRLGATGEIFIDNYSETQGVRFGSDVSLKNILPIEVPGYRRPYLFMSDRFVRDQTEIPTPSNNRFGHLLTGWSLEWSVDPAIDYLKYERPPLDYASSLIPEPLDVNDYFALGYNFESEISKRNLFGIFGEDTYATLSFKHKGRLTDTNASEWNIEYSSEVKNKDYSRNKVFDLATIGLSVTYPRVKDLSFKFEYERGDDIKFDKFKDVLTFGIDAKY